VRVDENCQRANERTRASLWFEPKELRRLRAAIIEEITMAIARKLEEYMVGRGVAYDVVMHPHSHSSMETAERAHVPGNCLAKSVVLEDDNGYLMAVLPSTYHVRLSELSRELNRKLRLATEDELKTLFTDCETGAIPPVGTAWGMTTVIDESLATQPEIYFEAGDHERLIRMKGDAFMALMPGAALASFSHRI
jgi:Ala-tRNA(Pro) deacylase